MDNTSLSKNYLCLAIFWCIKYIQTIANVKGFVISTYNSLTEALK